jgi:electron transport complex protein RnfC
VCPAQLQPQQLYAFSRFQEHDLAQQFDLAKCTECGACEAICPSGLPLVAIFREEKLNLLNQEQADQEAAHWQQRFERHQARTTDTLLAQQERKLKKLQSKTRELAEGRQITRSPVQTDGASPVAGKTPAQIQADIAAAVERTRARKAALQNDDSGKHKP